MTNIKWIPVKERLPEKEDNYYASIKTSNGAAYVTTLLYDPSMAQNGNGGWLFESWGTLLVPITQYDCTVIAWAPFEWPETYKEDK